MRELVLATRNKKKRHEMQVLLAPLGIVARSLDDFPDAPEVDETGATFLDNAILKGKAIALSLSCWAIGEDSGLVVDALGGAPGVYSARFSGPNANDESNNDLLLARLEGVAPERRGAHYQSTIALVAPSGEVEFTCEAICRGRILTSRQGKGGFGYDPLFEIVEYHQTFGELPLAVKSCLSHRARAMRKLLGWIESGAQR